MILKKQRQERVYLQPTVSEQTAYAGGATAAGVIIAWALETYTGVVVDATVAVAFGSFIGWIAGKLGT